MSPPKNALPLALPSTDGKIALTLPSTTFDLNGDGKVTETEYVGEFTARMHHGVPEGQLKQAHVRFGVLDTDKNGDLTLAEFNVSGERMFERLDTNGDGVVDAADTTKSY